MYNVLNDKILRAGLFERVSTEEQAKYGYSIRDQVEALEKYCKDKKIKIVDHYCDEGVSAGKPYAKRPEMKRLLDDVQAGKIDIILFTRLDRWFRNVQEYFKVQEILDNHKVEWKAIWEDYDTTTVNGRMAITIFLAIAQAEREKTAERIKSVFDSKRKHREAFFGRTSMPFGYMEEYDEDGVRRLVKNPDVQEALEVFWDIAVRYENINKAARHVTYEYGLTRNHRMWCRLVKNEIYTGTYKGVDNYCPAYVSKEDWLKLQNKKVIKKAQCDRVYMFTGLIRCPLCGKRLSASYTSHKTKKGKKEYFRYRCPDKDLKLCANNHPVSQNKIEKWLLKNIRELIRIEIDRVEYEISKPKPKTKANANLKNLKERLRRLEVVYMAGNKSDEEYIKEQKELKDAIKKIEDESPEDFSNRDITPLKQILDSDFEEIYEKLNDEERRAFWRSIVKEIIVDGKNIVSVVFY